MVEEVFLQNRTHDTTNNTLLHKRFAIAIAVEICTASRGRRTTKEIIRMKVVRSTLGCAHLRFKSGKPSFADQRIRAWVDRAYLAVVLTYLDEEYFPLEISCLACSISWIKK